jgi:hypothetical protein
MQNDTEMHVMVIVQILLTPSDTEINETAVVQYLEDPKGRTCIDQSQ